MKTALSLGFSLGLLLGLPGAVPAQGTAIDLRFDLSGATAHPGYTQVARDALYAESSGFGYEPGKVAADGPVLFSARVPEGNYSVTVTLTGGSAPTTVTLEAESGRLMLERVPVAAGAAFTGRFTTNVRTPHLAKLPLNATGREEVSLDQFDRGNALDWDDKLTVEILAPGAALGTVEIASAPDAPTVFLAGDSTVTDRDAGGDVSWGQVLPVFLKPGVAVANEAQSGETMTSFMNALRLDKILSYMKAGDYLFLQFGHNDSKASWPQTYVEPETTYKAYLKVYIAEAKRRGATPVLVTPMDRGDKKTGAPQHGHDGYIAAMKEVAQEENVALIDLYTMSDTLYEHAGADAPKILADGTHSTAYGGYEFAQCIATGIRQNKLELAKYLVDGFKDFDPAHPDSAAALNLSVLFRAGERRPGAPGPGPK
jgi:lysophospholipase L1-like esterase